jgi:hypothetical protein
VEVVSLDDVVVAVSVDDVVLLVSVGPLVVLVSVVVDELEELVSVELLLLVLVDAVSSVAPAGAGAWPHAASCDFVGVRPSGARDTPF